MRTIGVMGCAAVLCAVAALAATATAAQATTAPTACVASYAFAGPNHASGLATAMTRLASELTDQGVKVTLLHAGPVRNGDVATWTSKFNSAGLQYINVLQRNGEQTAVAGSLAKVRSFRLFEWLAAHSTTCDVVHVHDYRGLGYMTLTAKAAGEASLQDVAVVVQAHGNTRMMHESNNVDHTTPEAMADEAMEAGSLAMADLVTAPTQWYMQWLTTQGLLPTSTSTRVVPNVLPAELEGLATGACTGDNKAAPAKALAFFGRQTELKGLNVFLDAVEQLCPATGATCAASKILFVGPAATLSSGRRSTDVINERCQSFSVPCEIVSHLSSTTAALQLLVKERAVAVLPSLQEPAPSALVECALAGVPVIASNAGGLPEMLAATSADSYFEAGSVRALVVRAGEALASPCSFRASPAASRDDTSAMWASVHTEAAAINMASSAVSSVTTEAARAMPVTVAIIGNFDSDECLAEPLACTTAMSSVVDTVRSLAAQTQAVSEVLAVVPTSHVEAAHGLDAALSGFVSHRVVGSDGTDVAAFMNT